TRPGLPRHVGDYQKRNARNLRFVRISSSSCALNPTVLKISKTRWKNTSPMGPSSDGCSIRWIDALTFIDRISRRSSSPILPVSVAIPSCPDLNSTSPILPGTLNDVIGDECIYVEIDALKWEMNAFMSRSMH